MKRRDILGFIGGAVVGVVGSSIYYLSNKKPDDKKLAAPNIISSIRELKMVTTWPKNFPGLGTSAERLASNINKYSEGKLRVVVYAANELVPAFEVFDAVSEGVADIIHAAPYYWQGKAKSFNFFASIPFGLTAREYLAWISYGGGQELWDKVGERFNIKPFAIGNSGVQMGGWYKNEINSVEDIRGLKMRIPGLGGAVIDRMGGSSVTLPPGEIFQALESGVIDATEFDGPWNDRALGLYKIAKNYYYPGFHEPGTGIEASWNLEVYNSLSNNDKALITQLSHSEYSQLLAEYFHFNSEALVQLVNNENVNMREFPLEVFKEFARVSSLVIEDVISNDDEARSIYESFIKYRKSAIEWTAYSEEAYTAKRRLSLL